MKWLLIALLKAYRYGISPLLGRHCRFEPSCSEYAMEAVQTHGALRGGGLACARLCRCHPWHAGGYDPVPPTADRSAKPQATRPAARSVSAPAVSAPAASIDTTKQATPPAGLFGFSQRTP